MQLSDYRILSKIGEGGNAKVSLVEDPSKKEFALKKLTKHTTEREQRFLNEIRILKQWSKKINGIMPICDYSETEFWYTMPYATPVMEYIVENHLSPNTIIDYFIDLCYTIAELHDKNISHRDIKPANIYFYCFTFFYCFSNILN